MAVHIRLARYGTKKSPFYRVVVTDVRSPRDGRFIEAVGTFDPRQKPPVIRLNQARIEHWQKNGAKPTATAARVIKDHAKAAASTTAAS
jgi:small subunit ribosomal protein S16